MQQLIIIIPIVIIFYVVFINLYKVKISRAELAVSVVVACAVSFSVYSYLPNEALINFFLIIILSTLAFRNNKSVPLSLFFTSLTSITFMLAGSITAVFFAYFSSSLGGMIKSDIILNAAGAAINLAITFAISRVIGNLLNKKLKTLTAAQKNQFARYMLWGTVLTLFIFYVNVFIYRFTDDMALVQAITAALLVLYFFFLITAVYTFIESVTNQMEIEHKRELLENLGSYTASLENLFTEIRRFRHDYLNILAPFYEYIERSDTDGIKKYYEENILPVRGRVKLLNAATDRLKYIKPPEFKGLLSVKLLYAQELKIDVSIDITEEIETIPVYPVDLCRMAGVLIDNAIEECGGCENPSIKLSVIKKGGDVVFVCANTFASAPAISKIFDKGYSTKGANRGLGLYGLRQSVMENDNIALSTEIDGDYFIQELVFKPAESK